MQRALLLLLALAQFVPAVSLSAANQARLFLRSHAAQAPQPDELAELKGENPEAYALVNALLTKRSLGLLNPRHPTASFVPPSAAQQQQQEVAEQGPEVFSNMLRPGELEAAHVQHEAAEPRVAVPYAAVGHANHDWMNWKPQDSATNDDQMVQNVLGAVAELKGGKKAGLLSKRRDALEDLSADEASFGVEPAQPAPKPVAAAPVPHENSYLKSFDLSIRAPETTEKVEEKPKENSYLNGLDLTTEAEQKRTSQMQGSSTDSLASFSWDDDSKPKEQPKPQVEAQEPKSDGKKPSLMGWLGLVNEAPAPKVAPAPLA